MGRRRRIFLPLLAALAVLPAGARSQECPPVDATLAAIMAETVAQRADVTERLACHWPVGASFNDSALALEQNGFELLNKTERSFHRWPLGGEEFVSRRIVVSGRASAEFRVTLHMANRRIVRFSAQYLSLGR